MTASQGERSLVPATLLRAFSREGRHALVRALRRRARQAARRRGVDLAPFDPAVHVDARRRWLLDHYQVDLVLDVGANVGQFGGAVRNLGYRGRMVSFEPLSQAFGELARAARGDTAWEQRQCALGDRDHTATFHVAANSESSSLLEMLPAHAQAAPQSRYVAAEEVRVHRLDTIAGEVVGDARRIFLKIDTQGNERAVLDGAAEVLPRVRMLQFEASLVALYQGETLWPELHARVAAEGFVPAALESGFADPRTGQLLQVDALYIRL